MMKQLFKHAKRASIVLLAIFVLGCGGKDETDPLPVVTSSFTQVVNNTTGVVTFTNTSTNATTYLWDLNDGTTSTAKDPVNTYTTGTYTVKLTASNAAGGTATSQNTFTVTVPGSVDSTKPIITLIGDATINLAVGDPYTDKGATANDNLDGIITASIVKGGATVNTATAGSYVITYNVKDAAGNNAIEVTRTVVVVAFDDGLLANGAFSIPNTVPPQPGDAWFGNAFNVRNEGGSNFNFANVETAGLAYLVNLSQVVPLVQGKNYILSFDASSDRARTILAGIGLNEGDFRSDAPLVNLTTTITRFTLNLSALTFGGANCRVLFDMGAAVGVVVIDNVKLIEGVPTPCTAETVQSLDATDFNLTFKTDPGSAIISENTIYEYAANPNITNAVNTSCFVGKITKSGVNPWDNNQIIVDTKLDFTTNSGFKIKVYSPKAGTVLFKLEDKTNGQVIFTEQSKPIAQANEWQELTFDFAPDQSNKYDKIVLFYNYGQNNDVFYFDDLKLYTASQQGNCVGIPLPATAFPVTFEACESFISKFNDVGSITTELAANPSASGINTSSYSLKVVKATATNRWAGFQNTFASNMDLTKTFKLKIYSSKANVVMRFEVNSDPQPNGSGNPGAQFKTIVQANTWEEVEVVFTGVPPSNTGVNRFVIKPDNPDGTDGQLTSSTETYYFDDMSLETSGGGGGGGGSSTSVFCNTEVKHLGIAGETASAINLTIENVDAQSMMVSITSADADAVDLLILPGAITGNPAVSGVDSSVAGTLSITLTWTGTPPAEVALQALWSKVSFGGNWQLGAAETTVSFSQTCP